MTVEKIINYYYKNYHKPEFIDPDPLIFPRRYRKFQDIEIAAFISASFALGRVGCILNFLEDFFKVLGDPFCGLTKRTKKDIEHDFKHFKYRFYSGDDIVHFMLGLRSIYNDYGSIEDCFNTGYKIAASTEYSNIPVVAGLASIADAVNKKGSLHNIVANPRGGSACKRLFLFLRWLVRNDSIDPGGWSLPASELIIPLDTHISKVARLLLLTERKNSDLKTAVEITQNLKKFDAEDPVKFDFSISRIGINPGLSYKDLWKKIEDSSTKTFIPKN